MAYCIYYCQKLCRKLCYNLGVLSNYAPGGGTLVAFCRRILALGRWNLQMSWCKCPGIPRGQPRGMAADKCIIHTENSKLLLDLNCSPKELEKTVVELNIPLQSGVFRTIQSSCTMWTMSNQVTRRKQHLYCERMRQLECLERVSHTRYSLK